MFSTIALIGGGTMAEAIIKGMLARGLAGPRQIIASDPLEERRRLLSERYGVHTTPDNQEAVEGVGVVILAVKPQALPSVERDLQGHIPPLTLVLSILPGVRLEALAEGLGHSAVVRAMPNTPAQIGLGMTVWTASTAVSEAQRREVQALLAALGEEIFVEEERYLDMATAVSGSGPAYFFLFLEALVDAGVRLGFSREVAKKLVLETARGAVEYARSSPLPLAELRHMVTTPGGTSAEALYEFEGGGLRAVVQKAVRAAYERSIALGGAQKR